MARQSKSSKAAQASAPRRRSFLKIAALVLLCAVVGGVIVYKFSDRIRDLAQSVREKGFGRIPEATAKARATKDLESEITKMKRTQLEHEVQDLREQILAKERENSEMKIQLKLMQEGSRTGQDGAKPEKQPDSPGK